MKSIRLPMVVKFLTLQTFFGLIGVALYFILKIRPGQILWRFSLQILILTATAFLPLALFGLFTRSDLAQRWPPFKDIYDKLMGSPLGDFIRRGSLLQFFALSALAGLGEEWTFRGVLQTRIGIVAAAILFGLCHFISPFFFLLAGAIGLYLGWIYNFAGHNLFPPVTLHTFYDFLVLILLHHRATRQDGSKTEN